MTDTQISKIRKASTNGSLANIKFSKTQLSKIQSGAFMGLLNLYKSILSRLDKMVKKIIDEADKLSKKETLNDIIKTATDSKKCIKNF